MPRKYDLGKRAPAVAETRRTIVHAALEEYLVQGFGASFAAVAARADVAPGTVRYHFPGQDALVAAVIEVLMDRLEPPGPELLEGARSTEERIERLARALFDFYGRTGDLYQLYLRGRDDIAALREGEARFRDDMAALVEAALGEHADRPGAVQVALAMLDPSTAGSFDRMGLPREETVSVVTTMIVRWLPSRR